MKIIYTRQSLSSFVIAASEDGSSHFLSETFPNQKIYPSPRFWRSLWNELKVDEGLFDYFTSEEIFTQVASKNGNQSFRFCMENRGAYCRMLGMSSLLTEQTTKGAKLGKPFVSIESVIQAVKSENTVESGYHDGVVYSVGRLDEHPLFRLAQTSVAKRRNTKNKDVAPELSGLPLELLSDRGISSCFLRRQPVDGLGYGNFCYGVAIGDGFLFFDATRTKVVSSDGASVVDTFAKLRELHGSKRVTATESVHEVALKRLGHAAESAASLGEIAEFYRVLDKHAVPIGRFDGLLSHPFEGYGLASYNALSKTRLARLPTRSSVLDLMEAMALAAGEMQPTGRFQLYRLAGAMLAGYYDFEGMLFQDMVAEAVEVQGPTSELEMIGSKIEVDLSAIESAPVKSEIRLVATEPKKKDKADKIRKIA